MTAAKLKVEKYSIVQIGYSRMLRLLFFVLLLPTAAFANSSGRATVDLVYELGESRIALAEYILRGAADYMAENPDPGASEGHSAMKRILNGSEYFRSILVLDENGQLMFDSYNWFPFLPASDLSDRPYFRETTNAQGKKLMIGRSVVGKQSGRVFVPLSMAVPNGAGRAQKVVVLTAPPESMLPSFNLCSFCGMLITKDGSVLVSSHPMSAINEALISRLEFDGEYGAINLDVRGMEVKTHWRRSPKTGVVYLYYEAMPMSDG